MAVVTQIEDLDDGASGRSRYGGALLFIRRAGGNGKMRKICASKNALQTVLKHRFRDVFYLFIRPFRASERGTGRKAL
jgi:hypothetical protein